MPKRGKSERRDPEKDPKTPVTNEKGRVLNMWWQNTSILRDSPQKVAIERVGWLDAKVEANLKALLKINDTRTIGYERATYGIRKIASALLTEFKVKENDVVAVGVHENIQLVLIVLGIVRARCAFLPIDPFDPKARIRSLLKESKPT